mmetsp:Transcript_34454/g.39851  ORF Transcript_34454/g.39851 Transcript_34454/m.39851 type:complete len:101 (-) Transcript_34454:132-434(-)
MKLLLSLMEYSESKRIVFNRNDVADVDVDVDVDVAGDYEDGENDYGLDTDTEKPVHFIPTNHVKNVRTLSLRRFSDLFTQFGSSSVNFRVARICVVFPNC